MVDPLNHALARTGVAPVKNNMQQLRYPLEDQDNYKGRISFVAKQEQGKTLQSQFRDALFGVSEIKNLPDGQQAYESRVQESSIKALQGIDPTSQPDLPAYIGTGRKCVLYLPNTIQFQDAVSYSNIDLGLLGGTAEAAINSGASGAEALGAIASAATSIFSADGLVDAFNNGLQSEGAQVAALRIARRLNTEVAGAVSSTTGIALNPNKRATLLGPNLRTFRFTFKMIPASLREAEEIKAIVQFFREEMMPESTSEFGVSTALRYPSKFNIKMTYNGKKVAHSILPSFLTDVSVTYNAGSMAFHSDGKGGGNFQETDISLSFTEERTLNKRDIANEGY
tara:strand:- start:18921 stop:19937 length:1017 start_codon:yes stop_codon:yes gene_type:complete